MTKAITKRGTQKRRSGLRKKGGSETEESSDKSSCELYNERVDESLKQVNETYKVKENYNVDDKEQVYEWYKHLKTYPKYSGDFIKKEDDNNSNYEMASNLVERIKNNNHDKELEKIGFIIVLRGHGDSKKNEEGVDCFGADVIPMKNFDHVPYDKVINMIEADEKNEQILKDYFKGTLDNDLAIYTLPPFPTKTSVENGIEREEAYQAYGGKNKKNVKKTKKNKKKNQKRKTSKRKL